MNSETGNIQVASFRYNKSNVLGKGSTGTVYFGTDTKTGTKVAIKVIDMKTIDNQVTTYLLNNEKKALSLLKHPNVVKTYQIIQNAENCFIVGEYCQGGTLYDYIKSKGRLAEKQALEIMKGLVNGYSDCVKFGITHRDLKPANVLLKQGVPKIIDFGYAEIIGIQKPKIYYNVGSPSYMAPESIFQNVYSQKSDIWSLGVCLFEMLTGEVPLDTNDLVKTFNQLSKNGIKYPGYVNIFCRQIINRCLVPNIENRIGLRQLSQRFGIETRQLADIPIQIKRPPSQIGHQNLAKSVQKPLLVSKQLPRNSPIVTKKPPHSSLNRQPAQAVLKHSNQNKNQLQTSEYFPQPINKKILSTEHSQHSLNSQTQRNSRKINPSNIAIKYPQISSSPQQQFNTLNRNSIPKQIIVNRPQSVNIMSSFNSNPNLINSRSSNNNINPFQNIISVNNLILNNLNRQQLRPSSSASSVGINKVPVVKNLKNSINSPTKKPFSEQQALSQYLLKQQIQKQQQIKKNQVNFFTNYGS